MKPKAMWKISIDTVMTVLLLVLMARQLTGDTAHEWLGAGMMVLWGAHHALNGNWHTHVFKGRYTPLRFFQTVVNALLLLSIVGMSVSGVILSRKVFGFLPISGGIALARPMHILSAFWGYVMMALHLGLHWSMILGMTRKITGPVFSKAAHLTLCIVGTGLAVYGVYSFLRNQFLSYLTLHTAFVFFDFERPAVLFFVDYLAVMALFVFLGYGASKGLGKHKKAVKK